MDGNIISGFTQPPITGLWILPSEQDDAKIKKPNTSK